MKPTVFACLSLTLAGLAGGWARAQSAPALEGLSPKAVLASARASRREPLPPAGPVPAPSASPPEARGVETLNRFTVAHNPDLTPGVICTSADKDFAEYRYPERIPYCRRHFTEGDKKEVSRWYGVPWADHGQYQYDHLLSLCLGGSNALRNVWPMVYAEARKKAKLEADLCRRLERAELTQRQAVAEELGWFSEGGPLAPQSSGPIPPVSRPR